MLADPAPKNKQIQAARHRAEGRNCLAGRSAEHLDRQPSVGIDMPCLVHGSHIAAQAKSAQQAAAMGDQLLDGGGVHRFLAHLVG